MRIKYNKSGFSLTELMIAMGIGAVLCGIASFAFVQGIKVFNRAYRGYQAEAEMLSLMYGMKSTFSQSVNIDYGGTATANNTYTLRGQPAADATEGNIYSRTANGISGNAFLIGMGVREMGVSDLQSRLYGYGVFFQEPTANESGVVYVDLERDDVSSPGGFVSVSPINAPMAFSRLTEFSVENIRVLNNNKSVTTAVGAGQVDLRVLSAELNMVMRYYATGTPANWRWCPAAMIAGNAACRTNDTFVDVGRRVKIVFTNNEHTKGDALSERAFGNTYFFRSFIPRSRGAN